MENEYENATIETIECDELCECEEVGFDWIGEPFMW